MPALQVETEVFSGPLPLLCHLIEKNEIDITDIPISLLTEQYLACVAELPESDMDFSSEFILMAATLLEIKSKLLLPRRADEAPEEDPREELVRRLMEYKRFQDAAENLRETEGASDRLFFKAADPMVAEYGQMKPGLEEILDGVTLAALYAAFSDICARMERKVDHVRGDFRSVARDHFTIAEKTAAILNLLKERKKLRFDALFSGGETIEREEIVVTFLALLELIKQRRATVTQEGIFGPVWITGDRKPETGDRKSETGNRKPEPGETK